MGKSANAAHTTARRWAITTVSSNRVPALVRFGVASRDAIGAAATGAGAAGRERVGATAGAPVGAAIATAAGSLRRASITLHTAATIPR